LVDAFLLDAMTALVRAWVALYTWGLPLDVRERRRGEIDSHLHEQCMHDLETLHHSPRSTGLRVLWRCILGLRDDVSWRIRARPKLDYIARMRRRAKNRYRDEVRMFSWMLVQMLGLPFLVGSDPQTNTPEIMALCGVAIFTALARLVFAVSRRKQTEKLISYELRWLDELEAERKGASAVDSDTGSP
jgi:hypothetical protein